MADSHAESHTRCDLEGCNKAAASVFCKACYLDPVPEALLPEFFSQAYCSEKCRQQDADAHKQVCEKRLRVRLDLRLGIRFGNLHYIIFNTERKLGYPMVLKHATWNDSKDRVTFEFAGRDGPSSDNPFNAANADRETELAALYFDKCIYAVTIGTPLFAYLNQDNKFEIEEWDARVKAKKVAKLEGEERTNETPYHTVLRLKPKSTRSLPRTDPLAEADIILDPSGAQMFYKAIIMSGTQYKSENFDHGSKMGLERHKFGYCFEVFGPKDDLGEEGITFRVIYNNVFGVLESQGGLGGLEKAPESEMTPIYGSFKNLMEEKLTELNSEIDDIISSASNIGESLTKLKKKYDQEEGYTKMMEFVAKIRSDAGRSSSAET